MLNLTPKNISEPVNILYIITLFNKMGGAEKNLFDILSNIDKEKFSPHLMVFHGGELSDKIKQEGIPVRVNNLTKIFSFQAIKKGIELYTYLKNYKIQLVVTYHHDADIWGGLVARLAGVPVVISSRRDMGYQLNKRHVWFYRLFSFLFSSFVTVSDAVKEEISNRDWIPKRKITTIYNGLRLDEFTKSLDTAQVKRELCIEPGKTVIGMVASFRPIKGQIFLIEAISKIVEKHPDIRVIVVGYKLTEYFRTIEKKVQKLGLQEYFIFTGERSDVSRILSIFDIFVISSKHEGFSNAIIEAMAAGKPIIAAKSGGNPEAVVDLKTGLLFKPCNSRSLATAIEALLENSHLREAMGKAGRRRVEQYFPLEAMIAQNEELYLYHLYKPGPGVKISCWAKAFKMYYFKKTIKILLSYIFYYSGFLWIYKRFFTKPQLQILAYHSINKVNFKPLEMEQEPENFKRQMEHLKKNYTVLSAADLLEYRNNHKKILRNAVMLTFDDGYRDNYTNAYPILKELKIPAVFFITTQFVGNRDFYYFDVIRYGLKMSKKKYIDLRAIGLDGFALWDNEIYLSSIVLDMLSQLKPLSKDKQYEKTTKIIGKLGLDKNFLQTQKPYLLWDEVIEMSQNGIDFGSHTMTHAHLPSLSKDGCLAELIQSQQLLEKNLSKKISLLAYPFGSAGDYNETIEEIAQESGYEAALSLYRNEDGLNGYTIGRTLIDSHATCGITGKFCKPLFEAVLSGIME